MGVHIEKRMAENIKKHFYKIILLAYMVIKYNIG
jgi:hypothetical protein